MTVLQVSRLSKSYGRVRAVRDVSFAVDRGAVFGLLGPNGSGKTTALACVLGLLRPSSGTISLLGESSYSLHRTLGRVGAVFDAPVLVRGLTVAGQLAYSMRLFGHRGGRGAGEALERAGLGGLERRSVTRLSLGQQKRLAVATALAGRPELLVLDEPLSGLDPLGVRDFLELLRTLASEGMTIIVSSHRLHEFEPVLSHAAVLLDGEIARIGSMTELLGGAGRISVTVDDVARAGRVLDAVEGVSFEVAETSGELIVQSTAKSAAALNRALVEAGVAVAELRTRSPSLPALFEQLMDARHDSGSEKLS